MLLFACYRFLYHYSEHPYSELLYSEHPGNQNKRLNHKEPNKKTLIVI